MPGLPWCLLFMSCQNSPEPTVVVCVKSQPTGQTVSPVSVSVRLREKKTHFYVKLCGASSVL